MSATKGGDDVLLKYHIIVDIQCFVPLSLSLILSLLPVLQKFLTSHANIYTPPGCSMPFMADGERFTLGRVPSREREKDEERKRVKARKEDKNAGTKKSN